MKRFRHFFHLVAVVGLTGCSSLTPSTTAELQLTPVQVEEDGVMLEDHYTLIDGGGTVMSGALDGLKISFAMPLKRQPQAPKYLDPRGHKVYTLVVT